MVKITETYRIECDYCDCILELEGQQSNYITITSNDLGYSETEQESHYCNKDCIKGMIKTFENKFSKKELEDISEYYILKKRLTNK